MTTNYFRTHDPHDQVRATCIQDKCEYQHPDEETTHILNYIAGKEEVSAEENHKFYCNGFGNHWAAIKGDFDPKLYDVLWQMEMEYGSPQIRWINYSNKEFSLAAFSGNNMYNPFSHTIYLQCSTLNAVMGELMGEIAHASQYQRNQLEAQLRGIESFVRAFGNMAANDEKFWPAYCREYSTWDSLEYEAHRIIEPQLWERLKSTLNVEGK